MTQTIKFDPKQSFAEVWGIPGVAFSQNGHSFNGRGELITDASQTFPLQEVNKDPTPDDGTVPKCYVQEDNLSPSNENVKENLDTMHWKKLQVMLSIYGEEYKDRPSAIAFLKGRA